MERGSGGEDLNESKIDGDFVRDSYREEGPVEHYVFAALNVGLWRSEQILVDRYVGRTDRVLDLGCGAGRTTIGLRRLGYDRIEGIDLSPAMIDRARLIAEQFGMAISFRVADATDLPYDAGEFDAALFSYNGLMQIPARAQRLRALREVRRILRPGGVFIFTTHDRDLDDGWRDFWIAEERRWRKGRQDPRLHEFGDVVFDQAGVDTYLFIPTRDEMLDVIREAGLDLLEDRWRTEICEEDELVAALTLPCRFWVVRAPG